MLQAIRSKVASWVAKALFAMLILSFAVWGIGDIFTQRTVQPNVATVGDTKVTSIQLDRAFRDLVAQYRQAFGPAFDVEQARQFGLVDQALDGLVRDALFDETAKRLGLRVSDELVRTEIAEIPAFRDATGRFSAAQFRFVLQQNQLTEQDLVAIVRRNIAQQALTAGLAGGAVAPGVLAEDLYRHRAERRVAEVVQVAAARFVDVPVPDEATIVAHHRDNAPRFTRPETRDVTILKVTVDDLIGEVSASEDEIALAYAQRSGEFRRPERRSVDLVQADDRETAQRIADAARAAGDFAAAAVEAGREIIPADDAEQDSLFLPEIGRAAFALAEGAVSDPVETGLGWYVVRVRSVQAATERPLGEVRDELALGVRREKAIDRLFEFTNRLEDALAGGASLEEAATRFQLRLEKVRQMTAGGRPFDGSIPPAIPGFAQIVGTAFQQSAGQTSRLLETREQSAYAVRTDVVTPPALRPLDDVRADVVAAWQADERQRRSTALANELAGAVRAGAAVADAAVERQLGFSLTPPFVRDARTDVPADVAQRAFAMKAGEVAVGETVAGAFVVRLIEVLPAAPSEAPDAVGQVRTAAAAAIARDLGDQFTAALRQTVPVDIDRAAVSQLFRSN